MKQDFCFGCEDLMGQRLTHVAGWSRQSDFKSHINQLEKDKIAWVVKKKKTKEWDQEVWKYALFRKKIAPIVSPFLF